MEQHNYNKQHTLNDLVSEYEAMSQKGTVVFYEETVFFRLISYYESENLIDLALTVVEEAISQYHYSAMFHCRKAQLLAIQKAEMSALDAIRQAEILAPSDYEVKLVKAEILSRFDDHLLALTIIGELKAACHIDNSSQLAAIFFSEGVVYERMQQYDSMFVAWKQTLNFNPAHEEALDRIWLCVEMSRKFNESIELCNQLIDHDPYCDKAWYNLGHAHTYFGDYNEAIEAYEYAFIINNKFEWAYRHCAELCMEIQNYKKALDCYEEVLVHIPPDGELLFKIGQCYHFLGKISIAQKFYYQSIQLDDLNDEVYYYLGRCSVLQQNWEEATRLYRKAIEIEGKREEYFAALGQAYAKLNRNSRLAIRCFEKAIELAPEQSEYWVRLAAYLLESNNPQACLDVLMEADEHAVGAELLYCRAACLFKMEEKRTATNFLADALTEDYEGHEILFIFAPELKKVRKIRAIIDFYKYER